MTAIVILSVLAAFCFGIAAGDILATARANRTLYRRRIMLVHTDHRGQIVAERSSEVSWN